MVTLLLNDILRMHISHAPLKLAAANDGAASEPSDGRHSTDDGELEGSEILRCIESDFAALEQIIQRAINAFPSENAVGLRRARLSARRGAALARGASSLS